MLRIQKKDFVTCIAALLAFFLGRDTWGQTQGCTGQALTHLKGPETTIEIEVPINETSLGLVVPVGGTIRGALGNTTPPLEVTEWALKNGFQKGNIRDIPWDRLPYNLQIRVINQAGRRRRESTFNNDRRILGLVPREHVRLTDRTPQELFGQNVSAANPYLNLRRIFNGRVEYLTGDSFNKIDGVEFHVRTSLPSGEAVRQARTTLRLLGLPQVNFHAHITGRFPLERLHADPIFFSARVTEYYHRVNMAFEMMSLVEAGTKINHNFKDGIQFFGYIGGEGYGSLPESMVTTGLSKQDFHIGRHFKMGWVGLRGSDFYDQPGLWGLEVRALSPKLNLFLLEKRLNALQKRLNTLEFGGADEQIKKLLERELTEEKSMTAVREFEATFNQHIGFEYGTILLLSRIFRKLEHFPSAPYPEQGRIYQEWKSRFTTKKWIERFADQKGVGFLVRDWGKEPILEFTAEQLKKIEENQVHALRKLADTQDTTGTVQEFLESSGIYRAVLESVFGAAAF